MQFVMRENADHRSRRESATARAPCRRCVSPRPNCISAPVSMIVSPPSSRMATSKETRVRVEGLSNTMPRNLPASGLFGRGRALDAPRLDRGGAIEDVAQIFRRNVRDRSRKWRRPRLPRPHRHCAAPSRRASRAHASPSRRAASAISCSSMISGGSRRTTLSPAATVKSFSSQRRGHEVGVGHAGLYSKHQPSPRMLSMIEG